MLVTDFEEAKMSIVRIDGLADAFVTKANVCQGCVLSSLLFNVDIYRKINEEQLQSENLIDIEQKDAEQLNNSLNKNCFSQTARALFTKTKTLFKIISTH